MFVVTTTPFCGHLHCHMCWGYGSDWVSYPFPQATWCQH